MLRAGAPRTEPEPRPKGAGGGPGAQCPGRGGAYAEARRGGSPTDRRQQGERDSSGVTSSERNAQTLQSSEPGDSEARSEGPSMALWRGRYRLQEGEGSGGDPGGYSNHLVREVPETAGQAPRNGTQPLGSPVGVSKVPEWGQKSGLGKLY